MNRNTTLYFIASLLVVLWDLHLFKVLVSGKLESEKN